MFNSKAVNALQKIITATNASLLLTTSHKLKYNNAQWYNIFKSRGINADHIDSLPSDSLQSTRTEEILDWYRLKHIPEEGFVIIDDDKLLNSLPHNIKKNLVLTSPSVGLTDELAEDAISILRNEAKVLPGHVAQN